MGVDFIASFLKQIAPSVPVALPPEHSAKDRTDSATVKHSKAKQTKNKKNEPNQISPTQKHKNNKSIPPPTGPGGCAEKVEMLEDTQLR